MSHFTKIQTKLKTERHLRSAIKDLKDQYGLHFKDTKNVQGYQGTQTADIVVGTKSKYDIGFTRVNEVFEMVADFYEMPFPKEQFTNDLKQRYGYHNAIEVMAQKDFLLAGEEKQGKEIHLTMYRNPGAY